MDQIRFGLAYRFEFFPKASSHFSPSLVNQLKVAVYSTQYPGMLYGLSSVASGNDPTRLKEIDLDILTPTRIQDMRPETKIDEELKRLKALLTKPFYTKRLPSSFSDLPSMIKTRLDKLPTATPGLPGSPALGRLRFLERIADDAQNPFILKWPIDNNDLPPAVATKILAEQAA